MDEVFHAPMVKNVFFLDWRKVEISDLFYGWLLGFGKRVKLVYPDDAVEGFRAYLEKVHAMYE